MNLEEWNNLQCQLFKECNLNVKNIVNVYRVASKIAHLREIEDCEIALNCARDILMKEEYQVMLKK